MMRLKLVTEADADDQQAAAAATSMSMVMIEKLLLRVMQTALLLDVVVQAHRCAAENLMHSGL